MPFGVKRTVLDADGSRGYCTFEVLERYDTEEGCMSVGSYMKGVK
jgi:hypothetical protein